MTARDHSIIFILQSIHHVLRAEKVLLAAGLSFELIPVPKEVNPDCGMALEVRPEFRDAVFRALNERGLEIRETYVRSASGFTRIAGPEG